MRNRAGLILIVGLALPGWGQEKSDLPRLLTFLEYTSTVGIFADTVLTYEAILNHGCYESNVLWRPVMKYPPVVMILDGLIVLGINVLADRLWRKDKALAWVLVIGVNVIQAYYLYYHWRLRRDERWHR